MLTRFFGKCYSEILKVFGDGTQALTDLYPVLLEIHSFLWILGEAIFHFLQVEITGQPLKSLVGQKS